MSSVPKDIVRKSQLHATGSCPTDIAEFGERHKIPRFSEATYESGFMDGYRRGALEERMRCASIARSTPNLRQVSPDHVRANTPADVADIIMQPDNEDEDHE